jgi:hypothetical protein
VDVILRRFSLDQMTSTLNFGRGRALCYFDFLLFSLNCPKMPADVKSEREELTNLLTLLRYTARKAFRRSFYAAITVFRGAVTAGSPAICYIL